MYEYTLTLNSEQAQEINKALIMRWKLKQEDIFTFLLLDMDDEYYCEKRDAMKPALKTAMDVALPAGPVKDDEWYLAYNILQSIRYAIHEAEHPNSTGVDSYPPIQFGNKPVPECKWREV